MSRRATDPVLRRGRESTGPAGPTRQPLHRPAPRGRGTAAALPGDNVFDASTFTQRFPGFAVTSCSQGVARILD
ncbi:hypothetical protein A3L22_26625 [Streptomyces griseus subsp. griseus]|nr:hypothetical protein A3L22_26625 [Streptomyces griseus subsp. griseus]